MAAVERPRGRALRDAAPLRFAAPSMAGRPRDERGPADPVGAWVLRSILRYLRMSGTGRWESG